MTLHFGRKFWRFLTTVVVLFMLFVVGRNLVHAVKIKGQIGTLRRQAEEYREKIAQDSTLVERLRPRALRHAAARRAGLPHG